MNSELSIEEIDNVVSAYWAHREEDEKGLFDSANVSQVNLWPDSVVLDNSFNKTIQFPTKADLCIESNDFQNEERLALEGMLKCHEDFKTFIRPKDVYAKQKANAYAPWRKTRTNPPSKFIVNDEHEDLMYQYKAELRRLKRLDKKKARAFRLKWNHMLLTFVCDKNNLRRTTLKATLLSFLKWTKATNNINCF